MQNSWLAINFVDSFGWNFYDLAFLPSWSDLDLLLNGFDQGYNRFAQKTLWIFEANAYEK